MAIGGNEIDLEKILIVGAELPNKIFTKSFEQYIFSDVDIVSHPVMSKIIRNIVNVSGYNDASVEVYSSWDRNHLFHLEGHMSWADEFKKLRSKMSDEGNYGGLILLDSKQRWIFYQYVSVELGVFAIDSRLDFANIEDVKDCFIDCSDLARFSRRETQDAREIFDHNLGMYMVENLIKNYCNCA
jgi:hypothetical protein